MVEERHEIYAATDPHWRDPTAWIFADKVPSGYAAEVSCAVSASDPCEHLGSETPQDARLGRRTYMLAPLKVDRHRKVKERLKPADRFEFCDCRRKPSLDLKRIAAAEYLCRMCGKLIGNRRQFGIDQTRFRQFI